MNLAVRSERPLANMTSEIRRAMAEVDATLPLTDLRPMQEVISASVSRPRFLTLLLSIFAGVALALAAVGTYGVMSYSVEERRQEIGVRMALGAESGKVLRMVLGQGVIVAAIGLVAGVAGAFALTRLLSSLLFDIAPRDTATFVAAPAVLAAVAIAACWIPAWRATRVDPAIVLRDE
jgi:putative ABC transport system permease protein